MHSRCSRGRPTKLTRVKLAEITNVLRADPTQSVKAIVRQVGLAVGTMHKALRKVMGLCKCPAHWVAHELTPVQKAQCVRLSHVNLRLWNQVANLQTHIVTGDESWLFCYDPTSKQSTATWLQPKQQRPEKVRKERATVKVMLIIFLMEMGSSTSSSSQIGMASMLIFTLTSSEG